MDLLDSLDPQVKLDLMALLDQVDHQEPLEPGDLEGDLVSLVKLDHLDPLDLLEMLVDLDHRVNLDLMD